LLLLLLLPLVLPTMLLSLQALVRGAATKCLREVTGSGGRVIWRGCPGLDETGQTTLTRRVPACTVNSFPGVTPGGTVTR